MKMLDPGVIVLLAFPRPEDQAVATMIVPEKNLLPRAPTHQVIPRDNLRAGQDIELRKVQAMLSGQRSSKASKTQSRR
jgi:hypothetical protein